MTDDATTVEDLKTVVSEFVDKRQWQRFHNPKNLSMALAIEVAELMEHFQWETAEQANVVMDDPDRAKQVTEEVADCLSYLLAIASRLDIDLSTALRDKMIRNAEKYPIVKR